MLPATRMLKSHYSEVEAAAVLGVSVEELRSLIRQHIVQCEEDMNNVPSAYFQPSDILVLRMLQAGLEPPKPPEPPEPPTF